MYYSLEVTCTTLLKSVKVRFPPTAKLI